LISSISTISFSSHSVPPRRSFRCLCTISQSPPHQSAHASLELFSQ
jgi:hypothetical protein